MKGFIIHFDAAALFVFSIIIIYNYRLKNMHVFKNRIFLLFICDGMALTVFDFVRCVLSLLGVMNNFWVFLTCCFYTFILFLPVTFFIYVCSLTDFFQTYPESRKSTLPFKIFFPVISCLLILWMTPFTPDSPISAFSVGEKGSLNYGRLAHGIFFLMGYYYALYGLIVIIKNRTRIELSLVVNMAISFFMLTGSIISQIIFPYVRILPMVFSLASLHYTLFIQKPDFLLDSKTDTLNLKSFNIILDDYIFHKFSFKLVVLAMEDTDIYTRILNEKEQDRLDYSIVSTIRHKLRDANLFKSEFFGMYYLMFKNISDQELEERLQVIHQQIDERWGYDGRRFNLAFRLCVIDGKTDVSTADELRGIVTNFHTIHDFKGKTLYARDMNLSSMKNLSYLEESVLNGITDRRFDVFYQPIYSVKAGKLTRAEALIRLKGEDGSFISPDDFIPVAEKNGMIFEISEFTFDTVCRLLSKISPEEFNIEKIGINISVVDCMQTDLHKQIHDKMEEYGVSPSCLDVEITETASSEAPEILTYNMQKMAGFGLAMALDDYGFGNANISYLLDHPFSMIKIDKKIVWTAWGNVKSGIALKSTISMAHELGMEVVAEGVETNEQRVWLESLGCDYLQGYLFSVPVQKEEFLQLMKGQGSRQA